MVSGTYIRVDVILKWIHSLGFRHFHGIHSPLRQIVKGLAGLFQLVALDIEAFAIVGLLVDVPFVQTETADDKSGDAEAEEANASICFGLSTSVLLKEPLQR